jgi:hypothetical protein
MTDERLEVDVDENNEALDEFMMPRFGWMVRWFEYVG